MRFMWIEHMTFRLQIGDVTPQLPIEVLLQSDALPTELNPLLLLTLQKGHI